jgi:VWFA-related protein
MSLGRVVVALSVVISAVSAGPFAQGKQAPTFRTEVEAVSVDVSVLDAHRHPITGLRGDDFTILVDGRARPIIAFAAVDAFASHRRLTQFPRSLSVTNVDPSRPMLPEAASPGRIVAIVMPFNHTVRDLTVTARQIGRTIVEQLDSGDLAMVLFPGREGTSTATSDKMALLTQIESAAIPLAMGEPGAGGRDPCRNALFDAMSAYAESVRDLSTRRKVLFVITNTMTFTVQNECAAALAAARERLFHALRVSNVTVYTVDPTGLQTLAKDATVRTREGSHSDGRVDRTPIMQANLQRQGNLLVLPDLTGGRGVINTNRPDESVQDIFAETASYYVLGFQPDSPVKSGTHAISVRVTRRNAHVVARSAWDAR